MPDNFRRPTGENADGAPTVRNILPWRDMEKKVAERLAAKAARGELDGPLSIDPSKKTGGTKEDGSPDSGVRPSVNQPMALGGIVVPDHSPLEDGAALSFAVYTVADLDKSPSSRPPRMSMAFSPPYTPPSHFADVNKAFFAIFTTFYGVIRSHVRNEKPRPRLRQAMQSPIAELKAEAKKALVTMPWKKVAIGCGIAFGTLLVLLFIVLTAAELTDDLKPATSTSPVATLTKAEAPKPATAAAATPPTEAKPADSATIEIDDDAPAAAAPAKKAAAKPRPKAAASSIGKKSPTGVAKGPEMFVP